ncbi:MAG: GTPase Era [Bdellovibrio sp.]|nr:MAG: GTPase Era [Bdellovibrio sp.]
MNPEAKNFRAGFCGLIGLPNAGKSSLMNWLIQEKVSIVTAKPQTTRQRVLGLCTDEKGQVVFIDAPGLLAPRPVRRLGIHAFLEKEALDVINSSDVLLAVLSVDVDRKEDLDEVLGLVERSRKPFAVVLNKRDLAQYSHRRIRIETEIKQKFPDVRVFQVSTLAEHRRDSDTGEEIIQVLRDLLPPAPGPLYDPELYTPHALRELAAELIREQCFLHLHQEIPFGLAVRIQSFQEDTKSVSRVAADLVVNHANHKAIVIGKGGAVIKAIGSAARLAMMKLFATKVHLELRVVVRENWSGSATIMKELGYVVHNSN